ncbi:HtaA domain-containing protein [Streptomyces carpaticus]|uniref:HtaA domain-containing protein n=1 Tax=Streptomyces carpaticus TaxID=285558 RepID=UPI00220271EC|nr:HtaA domain-containing protein [Streptomyces carpaticus]
MLPRYRRARACALLTLLSALLAVLALPATAQAAERTVSGGRLDWGIRSSFLTYITGPIAQGSWSLSGGASTVGTSQFRFHTATGSYDPDTGTVTAGYSGGVRFVGHQQADGSYELDLTVANPTLSVSGGSGTLYADVRSKARGSGEITDRAQVALATLDLTGVDLRGGTQLSVSGIPATLTGEGATAFAGYYAAGDPLDPVTFTADTVDAGAPSGDPGADSAPDPADDEPAEDDAKDADEPDDAESATREITDAAVDWGVRRTFREYVTGEIAAGQWQLTEGAEDGGALFRFPAGEGTVDPGAGTAEAAFAGTLHFTGNDLDLALSGVTVTVADGTGTLAADITTADGTETAQPLVTFAAGDGALTPEDGLILIEEAPATLTDEGAAAFGLYQPGTAMDPVTLALAVTEDAELPALPDIGSEPADTGTPGPETAPTPGEDSAPAASSSSATTPLIAGGIGVLVALAALTAYLVRRRASRRTTENPSGTTEESTRS